MLAPEIIALNFSVSNTPDQQSGLISVAWKQLQTVIAHEFRGKLFRAENDRDMDLNYMIIGTTVDFCQFMSGVQKNLVVRIIGQNINTTALSHLGCPVKKGLNASVKDILISDTFLPPLR